MTSLQQKEQTYKLCASVFNLQPHSPKKIEASDKNPKRSDKNPKHADKNPERSDNTTD